MRNAVGSSDAVLMPVHVNRGKCYIEEQFINDPMVDVGLVNACIERTRFPVPEESWYAATDDFPGLVRAADLIGQLSDRRYLHKLAAIFFEFAETGFNNKAGYKSPGDLLAAYPRFFDMAVAPYITDAERYLKATTEGVEILDHLYDNLAVAQKHSVADFSASAQN